MHLGMTERVTWKRRAVITNAARETTIGFKERIKKNGLHVMHHILVLLTDTQYNYLKEFEKLKIDWWGARVSSAVAQRGLELCAIAIAILPGTRSAHSEVRYCLALRHP